MLPVTFHLFISMTLIDGTMNEMMSLMIQSGGRVFGPRCSWTRSVAVTHREQLIEAYGVAECAVKRLRLSCEWHEKRLCTSLEPVM